MDPQGWATAPFPTLREYQHANKGNTGLGALGVPSGTPQHRRPHPFQAWARVLQGSPQEPQWSQWAEEG